MSDSEVLQKRFSNQRRWLHGVGLRALGVPIGGDLAQQTVNRHFGIELALRIGRQAI
jgi:hypothetical protein